MRQKANTESGGIPMLTFDELMAKSELLKGSLIFENDSSIIEVNTESNRDIFKDPVRVDAYVFVICSDGQIELSCNQSCITLSADSMFLYSPGSVVRLNALEPSHLDVIVFNHEFFGRLGLKPDDVPYQYRILRERQVFTLSKKDRCHLQALLSVASEFISMDKSNFHYCEMVKSAFKTFIYRAFYLISQQSGRFAYDSLTSQGNSHFDRFIRILEENYKKEHSINFYSQKMGLSPKYMSLMIKKVSGKLATEWIDEYVILEAKNLLRYSSLSIQEIAYSLNFSNQSFFGKYFKRHTGVSPNTYRTKQ